MTFRIPKELASELAEATETLRPAGEEIGNAGVNLRTLIDELRSEWAGKSDRWQEGETGELVSEWIDALDTLAESMEELAANAAELVDNLATVEDKPLL